MLPLNQTQTRAVLTHDRKANRIHLYSIKLYLDNYVLVTSLPSPADDACALTVTCLLTLLHFLAAPSTHQLF